MRKKRGAERIRKKKRLCRIKRGRERNDRGNESKGEREKEKKNF